MKTAAPFRIKGARIMVIADIEGSSGCRARENARFMGKGWARACRAMTRDVNAVVRALLDAGAGQVHIQDFHRTGYNLIRSDLLAGASLSQGYSPGPVPGLGRPRAFHGLVMVGMHAPSGTRGFLPHTLTSRIAKVTVMGAPVSEAQLFSAALAPIPPLFFSGCPVACAHTRKFIPGIHCFPIDREAKGFSPSEWRRELAWACARAVTRATPAAYNPQGPFRVVLTLGERASAKRMARQWGLSRRGRTLLFDVQDFNTLFRELSRLVYLTPLTEKLAPLGLPLYNLMGRAGLALAVNRRP